MNKAVEILERELNSTTMIVEFLKKQQLQGHNLDGRITPLETELAELTEAIKLIKEKGVK